VRNREDLGLALAHGPPKTCARPTTSACSATLPDIWLDKDEEEGVPSENSGGTTVYLALGTRNRFDEHVALSVAPAIPIYQDLEGEQVESDWRAAVTLSFSM